MLLKLERDAYGAYARHSAIADYVELVVLKRGELREVDLARSLEKDGIDLGPSVFERPVPGEDDSDEYRRTARRVFALFEERSRVLGRRYPLRLSNGGLQRGRKQRDGLYLTLLAMTVAHAHKIPVPQDTEKMFERLVARCIRRNKARAATMGTSKGGAFGARLDAACAEVGLLAVPDGAIVSRAAQDENVDTLVHFDLGDNRSGRWTAIGQATIGSSETWARKIMEPSPHTWKRLIGEWLAPAVFLAVPHHVERIYWDKMLQDHRRLLMDRLRLAVSGVAPSREELQIASAVKACKIEW